MIIFLAKRTRRKIKKKPEIYLASFFISEFFLYLKDRIDIKPKQGTIMIFNIDNKEFIIDFHYEDNAMIGNESEETMSAIFRDISVGTLYSYNRAEKVRTLLREEIVIRHPNDPPSRTTARKILIQRLLRGTFTVFTRADRTELWSQYFKQTNQHQKNGKQ